MWVQAEIISMSTDVAEFLGAALALNLLFHVPLLVAGVMTGFLAFGLLELRVHGYRRFEIAIAGLLGLIFLGFIYETFKIGPSASGVAGGLVPHLGGTESLYLAVGIIGATVMPHAIYLHSALTQDRMPLRNDRERGRVLRFTRTDVIIALGIAGLINMAMLAVAAQLFHTSGLTGVDTIQGAHAGFANLVGGGAALAFAIALLASGASSSSVGTYAGQVVMAGFINIRVSLYVRRVVTMIPALVVLAVGMNPTDALVLSQVVLSFGIPLALIPLVILTSRREVMGVHVNRLPTTVLAWGCAILITGLNVFLVYLQSRSLEQSSRSGYGPRSRERSVRSRLRAQMALADTFQQIVDSLPDDWTDLELDLRIFDERRYVDAAVVLVTCNAQPYSKHDWHWRLLVAHRFGHGAAPQAVHAALKLLDESGIDGEMARPRGAHRDGSRSTRCGGGPSPCARSSVSSAASRATPPVARVVAFIPDLLFGSNVLGALQAAGHEAVLVSDQDGAAP